MSRALRQLERPLSAVGSLGGLGIAVFALLSFAYLARPATDPDYGWHVANGRHLLDGVLLAGRDIYSWTARGATWVAHEWLTEGVMAFLHDSLGPTANSLLAGALATLALLLTIARVRRRGFGVVVALTVGVIALLDAGTLVSVGPAAVEVAALALLLWLLDEWRGGALGDRAAVASVLLLMLAWANAHGSFVLGIGILGATWLGFVAERSPRARTALSLTIAGALVTLVNPFGIGLWGYVASAVTGERLQLITEWASPSLADPMWWAFVAALALALVGSIRWLRRPRARGPASVRLDDVLVGVALAVAGLEHARHAGIFAIGAAPLLAAGLTWAGSLVGALPIGARLTQGGPAEPPRPGLHLAIVAVVAVAVGTLSWLRVSPSNTAAAVRAEYPVDALPALEQLACGHPENLHLLNDYAWGGWLEMVDPTIPVFIDGRSEVFGDAGVERYATIVGLGPGWQLNVSQAVGATNPYAVDIRSALIPTGSRVVEALQVSGWVVDYADPVGTLLHDPNGIDNRQKACPG